MALRAENPSSSSSSSSSHLVGLPVFWSDATSNPAMDWDKWLDLFQVALMAKYSISITELTREATQQNPRVRALLGDLDEDPANKKVLSVMYLSLGEAARKQFMDKYRHTTLWELKTQEFCFLLQLFVYSFDFNSVSSDSHKHPKVVKKLTNTIKMFFFLSDIHFVLFSKSYLV